VRIPHRSSARSEVIAQRRLVLISPNCVFDASLVPETSDLSGVTAQMIVRAIIAGERDPLKLAQLSHPRIQASRTEIAKSLEGTWRPELIFVLQQELEMYDTYRDGLPSATSNYRSTWLALPIRSRLQRRKTCRRKRRRNKTRIIPTSILPMNYSASPEWI
jgi:hypothetical protein